MTVWQKHFASGLQPQFGADTLIPNVAFILIVYLFCTHVTLLCVCCNCVVSDSEVSCQLLQQWERQPSFKQLFHSGLWKIRMCSVPVIHSRSLEDPQRGWLSRRDQKQRTGLYWRLSSVVTSRVDSWGMLRLHTAFMSPRGCASLLCFIQHNAKTDRQTDRWGFLN